MRKGHFEVLAPVCPRCLHQGGVAAPLRLESVLRAVGDHIIEGVLHCDMAACRLEFPIIDGVPILMADVGAYLQANLAQINARDDLEGGIEDILGDAAGPGSVFDTTRQHLSIYGQDHYGDWDRDFSGVSCGGVGRIVTAGLDLIAGAFAQGQDGPARAEGPVIDLGCAVGRGTLTLAERTTGLVLGGDLNFAMLRLAQRLIVAGEVRYPVRGLGVAYTQRKISPPADQAGLNRVDYWAFDALAPPFTGGAFALASAINLADCVAAPQMLLAQMARLLGAGGQAIIATPFDWSQGATAMAFWLGGHSNRAAHGGDSAVVLRALLNGQPLSEGQPPSRGGAGLITLGEGEVDWHLNLSARSTMQYRTHLVAAQRTAN